MIERLIAAGVTAVAVATPLRGVRTDAEYRLDVVASLGRPVVLVGHSYGGLVITEAAAGDPAVRALVYVAAFAPEIGESAPAAADIRGRAHRGTHRRRTRVAGPAELVRLGRRRSQHLRRGAALHRRRRVAPRAHLAPGHHRVAHRARGS
ncbi:alpha/beta fold hydrolase [Nonomuraea polychroma]|uniref:alpha/beta fold hydrolase n=1 Tax=Nonomuraea polychroma TaxID=46176 RepID=UPI003D8B79A5